MEFDFSTETITPNNTNILTVGGYGGLEVPSGTTAQRPISPVEGTIRYNTDTGELEGFYNGVWDSSTNSFTNTVIVQKEPGAGQFSSIKEAMDSITGASATNLYTILVYPGVYYEDPIQYQSFVVIRGIDKKSVIIKANNPNENLINAAASGSIISVTLSGVTGNGKALINFEPTSYGDSFYGVNLHFEDGYHFVHLNITNNIIGLIDIIDATATLATYTVEPFLCESTSGIPSYLYLNNFRTGFVGTSPTTFATARGPGSIIGVWNSIITNLVPNNTATAFLVYNGGQLTLQNVRIVYWDSGVVAANIGDPSLVQITGTGISSSTYDIKFDHPNTTGSFIGAANKDKIISASTDVSMIILDETAPGSTSVIGDLNVGKTSDTLTEVTPQLQEAGAVGILSGGTLSAGASPATIDITAGYGYLKDPTTQRLKYISWPNSTISLVDNSSNTIWIDTNGVFHADPADPNSFETIIVGRALSFDGVVSFIARIPFKADTAATQIDDYLRAVFGSLFMSGSIVTENATPFSLDVSSGIYYYSRIKFTPSGGTAITFLEFAPDGTFTSTSTVNNTQYDNGGTLTSLTSGWYVKHSLYLFEDGTDEVYGFVFGQEQYATQQEAITSPLPTPPSFFADPVVIIASIVIQEGATTIDSILDERPRLGFTASSTAAVSDHGNLTGLSDDDHTQYLLSNGTRTMLGNLNMGNNSITNVNLVDGVDVSLHGSRHLPNGADPLSTLAAVSISNTSTNTEGIQNAFARSDHTHAITGFQPLDSDLTALANTSSTGIYVITGSGTSTTRSILGTGGRISINNADGTLGNPTIDISINYSGQNSITTLGTISTGTWNATTIAATVGGTGQTSYNIGDLLYADTTTSLTKLNDIATGNVLLSGGINTPPSYGKVGLTTHITGTLSTSNGGTNLTSIGTANQVLGVNNGATGLEYKTISAGTGISVTHGANSITIANTNTSTGTVTSVAATQPAAGLTISGSPITTTGTLTFALANDLSALEGLSSTGLAARTGTDTWAQRTITGTAGNITVSNGDGVSGNPTLNLATVGTAGTYKSVTTDTFGRVTSGTNPTTLAGFGITDAQPLDATLTSLAAYNTNGILVQTAADTFAGRTLTAPLAGLTITNPAGTAGNPTFVLANDLAALEGLSSTGIAVRSAADTWVQRTLTAGSSKISISNGDGVSGNPSVDVTESNLTLNNIGGTLGTSKGGTNLTSIGTANQVLGVNNGATGLEYKTITAGSNVTITHGANSITIASASTAPASPTASVQYNNAGVFGGSSAFTFINGTNPYVEILGTTATTQLRVGGSTDPSTATVYIETNNTNNEGQRVFFNSGSLSTSGWISYAYDGNTPYLKLTDADDDPPYISFDTIGSGSYTTPQYENSFGSRGPVAGVTTGFSWKVNGSEIASMDSNFFDLPSGTTAQRPTAPVNGMIRYNTTLGYIEQYVQNTWQPLTNSNTRVVGNLKDDFLNTTLAGSGVSIVSGIWTLSTNGSGTGISNVGNGVNSTDSALGVIQLATGSTSTGRACIGSNPSSIVFGYGYHYFETRIMIPTISTAAQEFELRIGFMDSQNAAGNGTDGAFLLYNRSSSTNWRYVTIASGTSTITNSTTTLPTANVWYKLAVEDTGTQTNFYIDDVLIGSSTTDRPTGATQQCGIGVKIQKTNGSTTRNIYSDYINYAFTLTATR